MLAQHAEGPLHERTTARDTRNFTQELVNKTAEVVLRVIPVSKPRGAGLMHRMK
jgi:hypothetical protein